MPKVSILMNCYNGEKYLKEAIDSIYAQTFSDWEIIFIDNCSTDNTKEIVKSYNNKIKYYKTQSNISLCEARVFAKEFITGDYFCVLDTDDLWIPTKLEKQVKIMENYENVGIIYSNSIFFTDCGESRLAYDNDMPSGKLFSQLLKNYFMSLETVMVRKNIMDKFDIFFDPNYNVSSDAEFFIRLSYYTECYYINETLAKWRFGHGSESEKSLCLFPKEYETLIEKLSHMIPDFNIKYSNEIFSLKSKINNMYGVCFWNKNEMKKSREYFLKALQSNKKYIIPFVMSYFMDYSKYVKLRRKFKKV